MESSFSWASTMSFDFKFPLCSSEEFCPCILPNNILNSFDAIDIFPENSVHPKVGWKESLPWILSLPHAHLQAMAWWHIYTQCWFVLNLFTILAKLGVQQQYFIHCDDHKSKKVSFQPLHRISLCFTINHIVNLAPSPVIITYSPKIVQHYLWTNYHTIPIKQHSIYNIANWKMIYFHPIITTDFVPNTNPFT